MLKEGDILVGKVKNIIQAGLFLELPGSTKDGFMHISQVANKRIDNIRDYYKVGDMINVQIEKIDAEGKIRVLNLDKDNNN